jgi:hypothetical protein
MQCREFYISCPGIIAVILSVIFTMPPQKLLDEFQQAESLEPRQGLMLGGASHMMSEPSRAGREMSGVVVMNNCGQDLSRPSSSIS